MLWLFSAVLCDQRPAEQPPGDFGIFSSSLIDGPNSAQDWQRGSCTSAVPGQHLQHTECLGCSVACCHGSCTVDVRIVGERI